MNNVKNSIGWADWTVNPIKGLCPVACPYCYARRYYHRLRRDPTVRYDPLVFLKVGDTSPGDRIFVGSTHELFLPQYESWLREILRVAAAWKDRTFILLTKQAHNLHKWWPFPKNVWVGLSATDYGMFVDACGNLGALTHQNKVTTAFVSIEPLLSWDGTEDDQFVLPWVMRGGIDWVIIGRQTPASKKTAPQVRWVREIVQAADAASAPVFLKRDLCELLYGSGALVDDIFWDGPKAKLRQEFPA